MRTNLKPKFTETTHEGAPAAHMTPEQALRRSVMSCMLWEREFYEDGVDIATRIMDLAGKVKPEIVAKLAIEARHVGHLRHAPLMLLKALAKHGSGALVGDTIAQVLTRADEPAEFLSLYWQEGKTPLSAQVKKGLAKAIGKFDEYELAKYNRDSKVKLRDVLFLSHAKPATPEQEALWKRLIAGELAIPDTWETQLSAGKDKKETFERLIREGKLGYLALLRNLRNMVQANCDLGLVREAILARKGSARVLPFRYVAAARVCPQLEPEIDKALLASIESSRSLPGKTAVLVDVSGSMDSAISGKSDMKRLDAGAALASVIKADNLRVFSFSTHVVEVPPRRGMSGIDAVSKSQPHGGTYLGAAVELVNREVPYDRLIVITDEQSADRVPDPKGRGYMINVASAKNGVGYGKWIHLDGFSENVIRYIHEVERNDA